MNFPLNYYVDVFLAGAGGRIGFQTHSFYILLADFAFAERIFLYGLESEENVV